MKLKQMALILLTPVIAAAGLHASFDSCLFPSGCDSLDEVRFETYYLIDRGDISFVETDSGNFGVYRAWMELFQNDTIVFSSGWERYDFLATGEQVISSQKVPDLEWTCLPAGDYHLRATVQDVSSGQTAQDEWDFTIESMLPGQTTVSDMILMARPPEPVRDDAFFHRQGQLIVPYADAVYGEELPVVYCYYELYNPPGDTIALELQVLGQNREQLFVGDTLTVSEETGSKSLTGAVDVSRLPSGSYYLQAVSITGKPVRWLSSNSFRRKFFVYNTAVTELPSEYLESSSRSSWSDADSLELTVVFNKLRPLLTPPERGRFRKLNVNGRRTFIAEFWRQRDPTPGTVINESHQRYLSRLDYVTLEFRTSLQKGWETDRGHVYLKYGAPDNREQHDFADNTDLNQNPDITGSQDDYGGNDGFNRPLSGGYLIWYYNTMEGGVYFVFVDRQGLGDFMLVHSTKSGEIKNYNWQQQL
jgi:GWxTD domain-containing protein